MKKYLFILAAAATCMLVACSKELRAPETNTEETTTSEFVRLPGWTYIGASNVESKASLTNDATPAFKWNTGDQIALFTDNNNYLVSDALDNSFNNATEAEFAFEGTGINPHRSCFAVYPASLITGCANPTANSLAINLPASYTLAQVQDLVSPIPMVAANAPDQSLAFKSICALLRITVKNVAKDAKSIKIRFPGQKVNGSFTLSSFVPSEGGVVGAASSSEAEETITITNLGISAFVEQMVINIPVPMGTFDNVVVSAYDNTNIINYISTPVKVVSDVPTAWTPGRKSRRTLTATLPVFTVGRGTYASGSTEDKHNTERSDCEKVVFAPGNLQAQLENLPGPGVVQTVSGNEVMNCSIDCFGTASAWRFAEHQYIALGASIPTDGRTSSYNSLEDPAVGDWIDLFGWMGDDATASAIINKPVEYKYGVAYTVGSGTSSWFGKTGEAKLVSDWGNNTITYGGGTYNSGVWRTPTGNEWDFVTISRFYGGNRIAQGAKATITTNTGDLVAYGLILLPDTYSHPYGVDPIVKAYSQNNKSYAESSGGAVCSDNVYTLDDWQKLEGAGCVFLPLTNMRNNKNNNSTLYDQTVYPGDGWYWSTTTNSASVYALAFNYVQAGASYYASTSNGLQAKKSQTRAYGCGVRLVRDVN